jgi:hypothetical protein
MRSFIKICLICIQNVPKFEMYKHIDEVFSIYYRIFYELWTFSYIDRLCKLEKRGDEIKKKSSPLKLLAQSQPNFAEMILGAGHIFGREPSSDYFIKILFLLSKWFQTRRFLRKFPIGSYVKLSSDVVAILVGVKKNLLLWNYLPNLNQTLLRWFLGGSSSKIVSGISELRPRWPPHPNLI